MSIRRSVVLLVAIGTLGATPAVAADYVATVAAANPIANFNLTAPGTPSTIGGYSTTWTATTTVGPGAPIAALPGNTGAVFSGSNAGTPPEVYTGLTGLIPGKGSINLWVNLSALPSALGHYFYLAGESQSGNDFDFQIQDDNRLYFYTGGGENTSYALNTSTLVGQWHMLTASYDGTLGGTSFRSLYLDGAHVATDVGSVNASAKSSPFTIGYSNVFGGRDTAGTIDEVAVFNYALSGDQVAGIYRSAGVPPATGGAVPEPGTWATMIAGLGLAGAALRRRRAARPSIQIA